MEHMILRKGSVSARKGERLLIPINMRDGALICVGKGNPDWNESALHGAGRLMSRTDARSSISMKAYKDAMKGIYTTCVNKGTLDESPFAYKPMDEIVTNIEPTAEIVSKIKPIYNFKAGDEE
jgi:RNA-splicing ligase RtcB